ncbi:hypothetical protein PC110_g22238 [Phytophthora cactorum]|uniref:Integrase catalytic domain-containing protein n=2 Tax=Phytophthora cactorum TaxID=29920 RepID=A0A329RDM4_9STRA|nr:hypothetical protein PC110_g22238 [Phytophthora cactorum]
MDSYNKCDRELNATNASTAQAQTQQSGAKQKSQQQQNTGNNSATRQLTPEKAAAVAAKKLDKQQGNCFHCHRPGHLGKDCNKKISAQAPASNNKQVTYTRRLGKSEQSESAQVTDTTSVTGVQRAPLHIRGHQMKIFQSTYFSDFTPFEKDAECVRGFKKALAANPVGHGTVQLVLQRGELDLVLTLRDVPNSRNLLSNSQIEDQGYSVEYHGRSGANVYEVWKGSEKLFEVAPDKYGLFTFNVKNAFLSEHPGEVQVPESVCAAAQPRVNISATDGAADLQRWHERLGHLCPQLVKVMVDRDLVNGMMLRQRRVTHCEACHMGKERKPPTKKSLDREITRKNEVIFADLLFPDQASVLVIVDGYSRFTTVYPLKSKSASEVNAAIQRYIEWGDRQFPNDKVRKVVSDGGGEFVNSKMNQWYRKKGIEFLPNPPHGSHLNPCERAHQTLTHMMKTVMSAAGLPPSLAIHALKMSVYIRNRTYHQAIKDVPYRLMKVKKPNLHRIKKFGSIAYVYKPVGPLRRNFDDNCRLGFLVGLLEGQAGYEVYFPVEHVVQHVEHAHINEDIVYKDRYSDGYTSTVANWMTAVESGTDVDQSSDAADDTDESDCADMEVVDDPPPARAADQNDPELQDYEDLKRC